MLDERKHRRHRPVIYLKVFRRERGQLLGHLVDISAEGLMVVTEAPIESGQQLHLQLVPPEDWDTAEPIAFEAEVRWSRPEANPELHGVGLVVHNPSTEFRQAVAQLTSGYVFSGSS